MVIQHSHPDPGSRVRSARYAERPTRHFSRLPRDAEESVLRGTERIRAHDVPRRRRDTYFASTRDMDATHRPAGKESRERLVTNGNDRKHLKSGRRIAFGFSHLLSIQNTAFRTWATCLLSLVACSARWRSDSLQTSHLQSLLLSERDWNVDGISSSPPQLEIFAAPKPFLGEDGKRQLRALESWISLEPRPSVTLIGNSAGVEEVARRYQLNWMPHIDTSFLGIPLFNAILDVANSSSAEIVAIANADILLFDDFLYAIRKVQRDMSQPWMLAGARWDIPFLPGTLLEPRGPGTRFSDDHRLRAVRFARSKGALHTYGGIDVWVWNKAQASLDSSLFNGSMPHFVFGRGKYDNWLTHEVIAARRRNVIDISEACTLVHILHDHHLVQELSKEDGLRSVSESITYNNSFWNQGIRVKFELYINSYLAAAHGTYMNQMGTVLHAPHKLSSCYESEGICLFHRRRPHACRCEHSPFAQNTQSDPFALEDSRIIFCGLRSSETQNHQQSNGDDALYRFIVSGREQAYSTSSYAPQHSNTTRSRNSAIRSALHGALLEVETIENSASSASREGVTFGLPLTLNRLLEVVEHRTGSKEVVLTMLNAHECPLLLRFVCAVRKAGLFSRLVVVALDDETYRYAVIRGFAVYLEEDVYEHGNEVAIATRGPLDSERLELLNVLRARVARKLLNLGRTVIYADPDVLFLRNPFWNLPDNVDFGLIDVSQNSNETKELERKLSNSRSEAVGQKNMTYAADSRSSLSLFYVRPSTNSNLAIEELSKSSSQSSIQNILDRLDNSSYEIFDKTVFVSVSSEAQIHSVSHSTVALHIGLQASPGEKVSLIDLIPEVALHNVESEICHCSVLGTKKVFLPS